MLKVILENEKGLVEVTERLIGEEFTHLYELPMYAQMKEIKEIMNNKIANGLTILEAHLETSLEAQNELKALGITEEDIVAGWNQMIEIADTSKDELEEFVRETYPELADDILKLHNLCVDQARFIKPIIVNEVV